MSDNVENAVFEILKKIQSDISAVGTDIGAFKVENRAEHERMEALIRKQRRDGAMLVMMRSAAGDFEERLAAVESQIALLEAREH